jgi:DNA invertase Pin-like site-specific DNA recombinase
MARYAYARVSSLEQSLDRQIDALEKMGIGIDENNLSYQYVEGDPAWFIEKVSSLKGVQKELNKLLSVIKEGDTLFFKSMDRCARSLFETLKLIGVFKEKKVNVLFLEENFNLMFASDPDSPQNIITQTIVAVIGAMNELQIRITKERQKEGVKMALERGVKFGRKTKGEDVTKEEIFNIMLKVSSGETLDKVLKNYPFKKDVYFRLKKQFGFPSQDIFNASQYLIRTGTLPENLLKI